MHPSLQLAAIQLRTPDLARSIGFYAQQLGFVVVDHGPSRASLATAADAAPILTLVEDLAAVPAPREAAGLFHAALLFPSRSALGAWLRHAQAHQVEFDGFADHGVSEALYFSDPDGNGLEFYSDRPRQQWPYANGELAMTTQALDLRGLLAAASPASDRPLRGAHWGHLHLRVTQLDRSDAFYRGALGMEVMQRSFPGARFLAADGYHHHLGLNTWGGPRLPQPPAAQGLSEATFFRPAVPTESVQTDPDGMRIRISPTPAPAKIP
ncbi:VOC family protein [Horticoccus sp. 23ND18S-11]|uniref:VOC family protein n=1 Tax=Horticoccus sp. 23ND18S-11 TaxID=3391832 RepID=UPI0039C9F79A